MAQVWQHHCAPSKCDDPYHHQRRVERFGFDCSDRQNWALTFKPVAGVRAIISKGWSDRMSKETDKAVVFPPECFSVSIRCFVSLLGFSHIPPAG